MRPRPGRVAPPHSVDARPEGAQGGVQAVLLPLPHVDALGSRQLRHGRRHLALGRGEQLVHARRVVAVLAARRDGLVEPEEGPQAQQDESTVVVQVVRERDVVLLDDDWPTLRRTAMDSTVLV